MKKQFIIALSVVLLTAIASSASAQYTPVSDTLQTNAIHARVQSNGAFFLGGTQGTFLVPTVSGGVPSLSLLKSAGLWLGGKDSVGNLRLSAQLYNENGKTDFYPGILDPSGVPYLEFNFIADVTKAEVDAHIADPWTPRPGVYGWPGENNSAFSNYHDFDMPDNYDAYAGFYDKNGDGTYSPGVGDYPAISLRGCPFKFKVDEAMWFAFQDAGPHTQSGGQPMQQEVQTQFFGFNCPEGSPIDRVVYVVYKFINRNNIPLDSCYFGVFLDFEIGNGGDDYIGSNPAQRIVYGYNGDGDDEGGFGTTAPVMAVELLRGPFNSEPFEEVTEWHFVPVDESELTTPTAYYNLLAGRHTDGSAFPNNGLMYTGDPLNPAAWNEKHDGNIPGERKALASFGPFNMVPGVINELILGYAWVRKDPNGNVADNLSILVPTMKAVEAEYQNCFGLFGGCPGNVASFNPASDLPITVTPNPFSDFLRVESKEAPMQSVQIFDATGRLVRDIEIGGKSTFTIQTGNLPPGFYHLQVRAGNGRTGYYKLIRA